MVAKTLFCHFIHINLPRVHHRNILPRHYSHHCLFQSNYHQIKHQTDGDFSSKHLVQRQFIKRYGDVLKLIVSLNKNSIHTDIVGHIEDLIDDDTNEETAIQRVLKRNHHQFDVLFDDSYFEINNDENNDEEEYSDDEHRHSVL
jgi:hypothetical protein